MLFICCLTSGHQNSIIVKTFFKKRGTNMSVEFYDGKIINEGKSFQPVSYDVTNQSLIVRFDGKGCISKYAVLGEKVYYEADRATWKIYINGKELPFNTNKKVVMIGRTQQVTWSHQSGTITMKLFLEENTDSVLQTIRADFKGLY